MDGINDSGFEGTDTGMGQGLAYVLPQSRSVGYFMQLANEKAQERRDDAAALAAQQQKANEQYAQHLYAYKTPEIAKDYTNWLQPKFDGLLDQASQYHAQTGQDPFINPDFIKNFNDLSAVAKNTHDANLAHTAYATAIADKSKNYTPESKQAGIDWLQKYHDDPVSNLYNPAPQLVERNLDLNDAVKLGHATYSKNTVGDYNITQPDRHNHVVQAQQILSQPEFAPYLQANGINPTVGDIAGQPNGHGGTIYPTDTPTVNGIADHILQNYKQPHYAATLQAAGIDPLDPHAKDKLTELVARQNAGYGKVYSQFADKLDAQINPEKVFDPAMSYLSLAQNKQTKDATPIYRQKMVSDMLNGAQGSGEQLIAKVGADPSYDGQLTIGQGANSLAGQTIFNIPAKRKFDAATNQWTETAPARRVFIKNDDPNADIKLNELTNELTGEKVDISQLRTKGGKKHLPSVQNNGVVQEPTSQPTATQSIRVRLNGRIGEIPMDKYIDFKKENPSAERIDQ